MGHAGNNRELGGGGGVNAARQGGRVMAEGRIEIGVKVTMRRPSGRASRGLASGVAVGIVEKYLHAVRRRIERRCGHRGKIFARRQASARAVLWPSRKNICTPSGVGSSGVVAIAEKYLHAVRRRLERRWRLRTSLDVVRAKRAAKIFCWRVR